MEQVYDLVAEQAPEVDGVEVHEISVEQDSTDLAVFCLRKDAEKVEEALRSGGFAKPAQICGDVPAQAVEAMKEYFAEHQESVIEDVILVSFDAGTEQLYLELL